MSRSSHRRSGLIPVDPSIGRSRVERAVSELVRDLVHRRYVRAVVVALCVVVIAGSAGVLALALRYDVDARAVWRYFTRPHLEEADLTPWLRGHATGAALEPLLATGGAANPGGLLYADGGRLVFHVHKPRDAERLHRTMVEHEGLYSRLTPLYWARDLEALLAELNTPPVRRLLLAAGATPHELFALQRDARLASEPRARTRLLLAAARQIQRFTPLFPEPFELSLGEELRFYEARRPAGHFLGVWEIESSRLPVVRDERYAHEMGRYNHFLLIVAGDGGILLRDYYRGERRDYRLTAFDHPARRGLRLYRLVGAGGTS